MSRPTDPAAVAARSDGLTAQAAIQAVLQSLVQDAPLRETLDLIVRGVSKMAGFQFCGIFLPQPMEQGTQLRIEASYGFPLEYVDLINRLEIFRLESGEQQSTPTTHAFATGEPVIVANVLADPMVAPWRQRALRFGYRSLVCTPLKVTGTVIGVLNGYGIRTGGYSEAELGAIQSLADQAALAVRLAELINSQQSTISRLRDVNEELEHQREVLERAEEIHHELSAAVIGGSGFHEVAQTLAGLMKRPIEVRDNTGRIICTSMPPPKALLIVDWPSLGRQLSCSDRGRAFRARSSDSTVSAGRTVVAPIVIGDELLGCVAVEEGDSLNPNLDLRAMEHGATVLALVTVQERVARDTEERLRSDFLYDLLNGRYEDIERLAQRARIHGLDFTLEHRAIVLEIDVWQDYVQRRKLREESAERLRSKLLKAAAESLAKRLRGALVTSSTGTLLAVAPSVDKDGLGQIRAAIQEAQRLVDLVAPGLTLSAGVGPTASGLAEYQDSYRAAMQCIQVIAELRLRASCLVAEELGVLGLLLNHQQPNELIRFADRLLEPVVAYDRRSGSSLLRTLEVLLEQDCDRLRTSRALFVHVNTVKYRIRRIEELLRRNLENPRDLLEVTLATLVFRLRRTDSLFFRT